MFCWVSRANLWSPCRLWTAQTQGHALSRLLQPHLPDSSAIRIFTDLLPALKWVVYLMQTSLSGLIASVKPTLCTSQRRAHPTFMLPTPIAHICCGLYLSGELLISWAWSRDSLNVLCKYSPVSCLMCLINVAVDPSGRLWYFVNQNDGECIIHRDRHTLRLQQHTSRCEGVWGVKGAAD